MIAIRNAISTDIDKFKRVITASILELCKDYYTQNELNSLLAQYPERKLYDIWLHERVLLVADDGNEIVGFAQYFPLDSSIEAVHVLPGYVKQGIGKNLVKKIEEIAKQKNAPRIILGSSLNAVTFYEKCGFIRMGNSTFRCNDGVKLEVINFEKKL